MRQVVEPDRHEDHADLGFVEHIAMPIIAVPREEPLHGGRRRHPRATVPGRVEVQLFPNQQLGDDKGILEGSQFGTIHLGVITNAVIANLEPT